MVPSKIDSPIWGMITSVGMKPSLGDAERTVGTGSWQVCRARLLPDYKSRCMPEPSGDQAGLGGGGAWRVSRWSSGGTVSGVSSAGNCGRSRGGLGAESGQVFDGEDLPDEDLAKEAGGEVGR